ncbi:MAG: hypothetical protein JW969_02020 [Spirochaetales bacterium]|nr:hypothetical protein [Spirochaetales bacterium]
MRKFTKKLIILLVLFSFISPYIFAGIIKDMNFPNAQIIDILIFLSGELGKSIVPDETVTGTATFRFINVDAEKALRLFLAAYKLYLRIEDDIYYVSRIYAEYDHDKDKMKMDAEDVPIKSILNATSRVIGKTIYIEPPLPPDTLIIHNYDITPEDFLKDIIMKPLHKEFELVIEPNVYSIKRKFMPSPTPNPVQGEKWKDQPLHFYKDSSSGLYYINKENERSGALYKQLFGMEQLEMQNLLNRDVIVDRLSFKAKPFDQMLRLICEKVGADYKIVNGIYYIVEMNPRDVMRKFWDTTLIPLKYITPMDVQRLLPSELGSSKFYRLDTNTNTIVLYGSQDETKPLIEFIREIDTPMTKAGYYRYDLKYIKANMIKSMFPVPLRNFETIVIQESNSVIIQLSPESKEIMDDYIALLDRAPESTPIKLKYIKAESLVKALPPSVAKEDVIVSDDPYLVFFKGPKEKKEDFLKELEAFDQPVPQIRYQLLVISYQKGNTLEWTPDYTVAGGTDPLSANVNLSSLVNFDLNFDVTGAMGIAFAANLSLSLSDNTANVLADTTLTGQSGKKLSFQDQENHRFRSPVVNSTTGKTEFTGPETTVSTGFSLAVEGTASGDRMITMDIDMSMKKTGSEPAIASGDLGTTFDKTIKTFTSTESGKLISIGGLIKQDINKKTSKVPILGDIPLLGLLFQSVKDVVNNSEIVVYILPHIVYSTEELEDADFQIKRFYNKFLAPKGKEY